MGKLSEKEVKQHEFDILVAFDEYASSRGLAYSLGYGTLIGAVRHEGFIPWDDDIDVLVPRADYEKIVEDARQGFQVGPYRFTGNEVDGFPMPFIKMIDMRIDVHDSATKDSIPLNLWIDVFPLDALPGDRAEAERVIDEAYNLRAFIKVGNYKFIGAGKTFLKRLVKMALMPFVMAFGMHKRAEGKIISLAKNCGEVGSPYVGNIVWGPYRHGEILPAEMFGEYTTVTFEGREFPAMKDWDGYLSSIYGDYMKLPPESKRFSHGVDAEFCG